MDLDSASSATNGSKLDGDESKPTSHPDSIRIDGEVCFYCRKKATKYCQFCKLSFHCSDEHGSTHRPDNVCFPIRIEHSPQVGNYVVASRDIESAGMVFQTSLNI